MFYSYLAFLAIFAVKNLFMNRLGIIDWGIGGISVYKLLKQKLGDIPVTYFSDTGVTPYGKMARREVASRLDFVIEFLIEKGVSHVVIGCNAASTAIGDLARHSTPVEGVIEPAIEMTANIKPSSLGLIGGRRTVVSGVYRTAFTARGIKISQRIAQPLSALIESGDVSSDELKTQCQRILSPIKNSSHILLACTHYPAITEILREFVSPATQFIDPAAALVDRISKWNLESGGADEFLTTGDTKAMKKAAKAAFGVEIDHIQKITI